MEKQLDGHSSEFSLIERLAGVLGGGAPPEILVGIGDDCAVARRGAALDVYTTDTLVDGVHFRRGQIPWFDLGWKSIAVSLSDIAAMGAEPMHCLVTLGVPEDVDEDDLAEVYRGMSAVTGALGGSVVGGDVVRSPQLFITVSATGSTPAPGDGLPVLLRSNAAPGDVIAVTGRLGSAAGGLRALETSIHTAGAERLIVRLHRPNPRIDAGAAMVRAGVRCAIDISDGVVADLGHICDASGVDATVRIADIPVEDALKQTFPDEWQSLALSGGEDYELLFTAPADVARAAARGAGAPVSVIGEVLPRAPGQAGGVTVLREDGSPLPVADGGWDHLRA